MNERERRARKARLFTFCLGPQSSEMDVDDHKAEEHQRFDERETQDQSQLNAVVRARIASHAFAGSRRDTPLADAAQPRRYPESYARANVTQTFADTATFSSASWRLSQRSHRRKEHGHQP